MGDVGCGTVVMIGAEGVGVAIYIGVCVGVDVRVDVGVYATGADMVE